MKTCLYFIDDDVEAKRSYGNNKTENEWNKLMTKRVNKRKSKKKQ